MVSEKAIAVLIFRDEDGDSFEVKLGPGPIESIRLEARREIIAHTDEGYELEDYRLIKTS